MRNKSCSALLLLFWLNCAILVLSPSPGRNTASVTMKKNSILVQTIYGETEVTEPLLLELLTCGALERLKYVRQYGTIFYAIPEINSNYTRYEHSLGVFFLSRLQKASLKEQAASLIHDLSHTVFSHVGDYWKSTMFSRYAYQDQIHGWYLEQCGIGLILRRHGLEIDDVLITTGRLKILKAEKPSFSADSLEYILMAGVLTNAVTCDQVRGLLNDVVYGDDRWFFTSIKSARQFALISLFNTEHVWGGIDDHLVYKWSADAVARAIEINEITEEDIHFSVDAFVWERLCESKDEKIKKLIFCIMHHKDLYTVASKEHYTERVCTKFRGIDPLIKIGSVFKRLTEFDSSYKKEFDRVKRQVTDGWYINIIGEEDVPLDTRSAIISKAQAAESGH